MRLNNEIRESIINAALNAKFAEDLKSLEQQRVELADALYAQHIHDAPSRDPEWVIVTRSITASHEGLTHRRLFREANRAERTFHPILRSELQMSAAQPMPQRFRYGGELEPEGELLERFNSFLDRVAAVREEFSELEHELGNLLNSFNTFKQLETAWPDGAPLYAKWKPAPRVTALVDTKLVARVTSKLTPPLK